MRKVVRLVSFADIDPASTSNSVEVSVSFEAELDNRRSVLLLDDRGWGSTGRWADSGPREIVDTARVVVGPDEPYGDQSPRDAVLEYWAYIQEILARQEIEIEVSELRALRHDVVLSKQLQERLGTD